MLSPHLGRLTTLTAAMTIFCAGALGAQSSPSATPALPSPEAVAALDEALRNRLEAAGGEGLGRLARVVVGREPVYATAALPTFYERRSFQPAWLSGGLDAARELVGAIRAAEREGLRPSDYHLERLQRLLERIEAARATNTGAHPELLIDLELLLTDAFLVYGSHLVAGRVDPVELDPEWRPFDRGIDMVSVLERALERGEVAASLQSLLPGHAGYANLRDALTRYRALRRAGGWSQVDGGPALRPGDRGERVRQLRQRLAATRDLSPRLAGGDGYDEDVEGAVRAYQERHGLEVDGAVGLMTLAELNAPVEQRIGQIELNMERWRWLPEDLGARHIRVNIAGFDLSVHEDTGTVTRMRAMVGHQYRKTPVFSDTVRLVVFAPYWNVPRTIAVQDIVPKVREDVGYLERNRIEVWAGWGESARRVAPRTVDWARVDTTRFAYRFRQDPGATNPLGRVKFLFPNRFDVYVHDTPGREMFAKAERAFSSGCIRIERPAELAHYLLASAGWSEARAETAMQRTSEQTVRVARPVPIHILYWTAWIDDDGRVQFRNDIYLRDGPLREAMQSPPPTALRLSEPLPASG